MLLFNHCIVFICIPDTHCLVGTLPCTESWSVHGKKQKNKNMDKIISVVHVHAVVPINSLLFITVPYPLTLIVYNDVSLIELISRESFWLWV